MRQQLSIAIALCTTISLGAVPPEFLTTGDGSYYAPYQLSKAAHIVELAQEVADGNTFGGKFLVLTADIDMASVPEWMPQFAGIGVAGEDAMMSRSFRGDFNGRHYTISHLALVNDGARACGFFNSIDDGAYVHHLMLDGSCSVAGGSNTGAVAGCVWDGMIEFCSSAARVSGSRNVGGIAGTLHSGVIQCCVNSARIDAVKGVGGVVGLMDGATSVAGCYNTGVIAASAFGACGGIVGQAYGYADVKACYNTGHISGRPSVEFDIQLSNIISDAPAVVWKGVMADCCAVGSLSGIVEDGVTDFQEAAFRSADALDFLNEASRRAEFSSNPNSTAVAADRLFIFADGLNDGFPVQGWLLGAPGTSLESAVAENAAFEVCGDAVRSLSDRPLTVFSPDGIMVGHALSVRLPAGIYIVNHTKIHISR